MYSRTRISWTHIDLSFTGPMPITSYLIPVNSYSELPEVKSATNGTIINGNHQVFTTQVISEAYGNRDPTKFSFTRLEISCRSQTFSAQDRHHVGSVKSQLLIS
nr:hypothetical protein HmN_000487000 [Hymenolepis microstoma]